MNTLIKSEEECPSPENHAIAWCHTLHNFQHLLAIVPLKRSKFTFVNLGVAIAHRFVAIAMDCSPDLTDKRIPLRNLPANAKL